MISTNQNGNTATLEAVRAAVQRHGATREELIPILTEVNRTVGYLPAAALDEISRLMHVPKSQLFSVATFYRMLSTKKLGKHIIQFCESAPCHVAGGRQVWLALQSALDLEPGETTPDGKWTLATVSCLGLCGVGPVMVVDEDMYGNVTPNQVPEILAKYE
ncbi:MAG: NADH-quinone oxidoreductase subunit NuoE [Anaerolineaceae bacterium]|nr:NADH-quinone oxidoreductase subunit NuoE [Anaerolineaceae bacterium]